MAKHSISLTMILHGLQQNIVQLIDSPHEDGPVCQIGENWFYFSCFEESDMYLTAEDFRKSHPDEEIARLIYTSLSEFPGNCMDDEYLYYYWYLVEHGIS